MVEVLRHSGVLFGLREWRASGLYGLYWCVYRLFESDSLLLQFPEYACFQHRDCSRILAVPWTVVNDGFKWLSERCANEWRGKVPGRVLASFKDGCCRTRRTALILGGKLFIGQEFVGSIWIPMVAWVCCCMCALDREMVIYFVMMAV